MRIDLRAMLVAVGMGGALAASCAAQSAGPQNQNQNPNQNPAPCTVAPQPAPCGSANSPSSAPNNSSSTPQSNADRFPFPGEGSATGASTPAAPQAPSAGGSTGAAGSPAAAFPFPGEPVAPAAGGSSSSSSSSSGDDANAGADPNAPAAGGLQDRGSEGSNAPQGRHLLHRVNPIGTKLQSTDEREAEDLDVAHFYMQSGDLKGAYMRSQDAVKIVPDDPEAHFALAEIALKLGKRDEAIAEYNKCLKLDPVDKEAKAARKELAKLKP